MPFRSVATPRIVSLVPSQTELLFALGLDDEIVGLTRFCVHPADKVAGKTKIGGTKNVSISAVNALQPTWILANHEENTEADVKALQQIAPVHITDISDLAGALHMIAEVGALTSRPHQAAALVQQISAAFATHRPPANQPPLSVAYLIWRRPWMVAARDTFIDAMLTEAGFCNAFASQTRYPIITEADLQQARPDVLLLSTEPYPFNARHIPELTACCPAARIRLVDGELFSWYGSRLLQSAAYFARLRTSLATDP